MADARCDVRILFVAAVCIFGLSTHVVAQSHSVVSSPTNAAGDWQRVKQLPVHTRVHLSTDKKGLTCSIDAVDDGSLTCSSGHLGTAYPRAEIKSIKVTRYPVSVVGGAGIGAGVGAGIGAAFKSSGGIASGAANGVKIGIGAVAGGLGGAAVGAATDMFRGPLVYRRPAA
jgi:hypothetical protein